MSARFGPVIQQGYVVPDIQAAMRHWIARGSARSSSRSTSVRRVTTTASRFGPTCPRRSRTRAISRSRSSNSTTTIRRSTGTTSRAAHPDGGLQHLAVWVDDIARTVADLDAAGRSYTVRQRYGDGHAYLDSDDEPGVMVQLMARREHLVQLMETIRAASIGWDGVTAPIRRIDWSSGKPVPEVVEE